MARASNWPALLTRFLEEKRNKPFDWGTNNCCFWAADWCQILTGIDPAQDLRGRVTDEKTAKQVLARRGGVAGIALRRCKKHHWPELARRYAQRGDLVLFIGEHGPTLGVCCGSLIGGPGGNGIEHRPMKEAVKAWRIN